LKTVAGLGGGSHKATNLSPKTLWGVSYGLYGSNKMYKLHEINLLDSSPEINLCLTFGNNNVMVGMDIVR